MIASYKTIQSVMALMIKGHELPVDIFKDLLIYFTSGQANDTEIAGFLKIFSEYPLKVDYVISAIDVLRTHMIEVNLPDNLHDAIDCCGTGGDGLNSLNISTAVAFVLTDYGVTVAKHGNRSVTSQSGSADILEFLGYPIQKNPDDIVKQLEKTGLSFMFAPYFHPILRHVAQARKALNIKTFFNLLGPLLNPAQVKRQLIGIYDFKLASIIAETLIHFGVKRAMIVTSHEGADELTLSGDNQICYIDEHKYWFETLNAKDVGLKNSPISEIAGGDIAFNANAFKTIFKREPSVYYDTVLLNAAAGLWVAGKTETIAEGIQRLKMQKHMIDFNKFCVLI
jgi:anthranilate phosphoribosyltransferase